MAKKNAFEFVCKSENNSVAVRGKTRSKVPESLSQWATFLDLPPEVRITIYKLCLTGATLFINENGIDLKFSRARGELARTSKEIYHEAMPILYSLTTLVYHGLTKGPASINLIPQYQKYIPRMVLETTIISPLDLRNLKDFKSLQSLCINIGQIGTWIIETHDIDDIRQLPAPGDAKLVTKIVEGMKNRRYEMLSSVSSHWPKGSVKFEDFNRLASNKKRAFKLEFCVCIIWTGIPGSHGWMMRNIGLLGLQLIIDWDSKTIISKTISNDP